MDNKRYKCHISFFQRVNVIYDNWQNFHIQDISETAKQDKTDDDS